MIPSAKLDVRYHQEMTTVFHVTSVRCFISHVRDVIAFALFKIKIKDAVLHNTRYVIHFYYKKIARDAKKVMDGFMDKGN